MSDVAKVNEFESIALGETGQPALELRVMEGQIELEFFGAGDAIALILGTEDLHRLEAGVAGAGLLGQVAALVEGDLSNLQPHDPAQVDPDPEGSRRTYVYPWAGRRRRLAAVVLGDSAGPEAIRVQGDRLVRDLKKTCRRVGFILGARWAQEPTALSALAEGVTYGNFVWKKFKTRGRRPGLERAVVLTEGKPATEVVAAVGRGAAIAGAGMVAKGLTLEPPERLHPGSLADRALEIAADLETVRCESWSADRIRRERLAGMLAVGRGAAVPVSQIEYVYEPPGGADKTVVLVGKGVTYDCGGLQDKGPHMNHMNRDMAGAAGVVAMMTALDALRPRVRVVGLAGATENMNGPNAYKTDEVITHRDGRTTTVGHTDAEGRLVLYDQLVYAREAYDADLIIDMATLTGAVKMALGTDTIAVISNKRGTAARDRLLAAARAAGEKAWPLPQSHDLPNSDYVVADYEKNFNEVMEGKSSDLDNDGNKEFGAGTSKGGAFLSSAIDEQVPWLHLDVAYTAMDGPMGSPVPTLCQLLMDYS